MFIGAGICAEPYYSTQNIYADAMKSSQLGWRVCKVASPTYPWPSVPTTQPLDANGYPIGLTTVPTGEGVATCTYTHNGIRWPMGTYTLIFTGEGTVLFSAGGKTQSFTSAPGASGLRASVPITVQDDNGIVITIAQSGTPGSSQPGNYISNIQLLIPGATGTFNPAFLAELQPFAVLRVMDYLGVNSPTQLVGIDLANVPPINFQTQATTWGTNFSYPIMLAQTLNKDVWINVPVGSTVAYQTALASYALAAAGPARKIYLEYGNECWNAVYHAEFEAINAFAIANGIQWDLAWATMTSACFALWKSLDTNNQVVRVAGCQWSNTSLLYVHLMQLAQLNPTDPNRGFDVCSGAPYFGPSATQLAGYTSATTTAEIEADCLAAVATTQTLLAAWQAELAIVQAKSGRATAIPTCCYEGGIGLTPPVSSPYYAAAIACQTDPGMQAVVTAYLEMLASGGITGLAWTNAIFPATQYGQWGLQQYTGEPGLLTPKLSAAKAYLAPAPTPAPAPAPARS